MSYRYTFTGVIHPERAAISMSTIPLAVQAPSEDIDGRLYVTIAVSQVTAVFESEQRVRQLHTLKNHVTDAVRVAVDAFGYLTGCGYGAEIVQVVPAESTNPMVFGVDIPALEYKSPDLNARFTEVMSLFWDPRGCHLQRCLADLREAIRSPKDTGFFCYRAIEALRQFFVIETNSATDKESWDAFRTTLQVDRASIDYIKTFADPVRHGAGRAISDGERAEVFKKTWSIVGRFIEFAKRGYRALEKQDA
jgi:hypothetical protein